MICSRFRCVTGVWGFESDKQVKRLIHCATNTALIGCDKHWVTLVNDLKYILSIGETFYRNFLREIHTFMSLTLKDNSKNLVSTVDLDPLFHVDLSSAQEKASQLIQILKIMNTIASNFFKKQLSVSENWYKFYF